jgi:hypothetical protein
MQVLVVIYPPTKLAPSLLPPSTSFDKHERFTASFIQAAQLLLTSVTNIHFIFAGFTQKLTLPNKQWSQCTTLKPNDIKESVQDKKFDFVLFTHVNTDINYVLFLQRLYHLKGASRGSPIVWGNKNREYNECMVSRVIFQHSLIFKCQQFYELQDIWMVEDSRYIVNIEVKKKFVGYPGIVELSQSADDLLAKARKHHYVYSWWKPEKEAKQHDSVECSKTHRLAVIIVNYNMPERAEALYKNIQETTKWPVDIILVDNGSQKKMRSPLTSLQMPINLQTSAGFLAGVNYAKHLRNSKDLCPHYAYSFWITSTRSVENRDFISILMQQLLNGNAVGIHPELTAQSSSHWQFLKPDRYRYEKAVLGKPTIRKSWLIDNIASLYRASWFDSVGRFDPALSYAWGIDIETAARANEDNVPLYLSSAVHVEKITNIGYKMGRMGMKASSRVSTAEKETCTVMKEKYPYDWPSRLLGSMSSKFQYDLPSPDEETRIWRMTCHKHKLDVYPADYKFKRMAGKGPLRRSSILLITSIGSTVHFVSFVWFIGILFVFSFFFKMRKRNDEIVHRLAM